MYCCNISAFSMAEPAVKEDRGGGILIMIGYVLFLPENVPLLNMYACVTNEEYQCCLVFICFVERLDHTKKYFSKAKPQSKHFVISFRCVSK